MTSVTLSFFTLYIIFDVLSKNIDYNLSFVIDFDIFLNIL